MRLRIRIKSKITVKSGMKLVCAVVIALIPILFSYKQFFSISPTYLMLILCTPFALLRLGNRKLISVKNLGWIAAYLLYCMVSHGIGISEIIVTMLFLIYALAANNGVFDEKPIWKSIVVISCIATVGILLQIICYYLLGTRLFLCPTGLMEQSVWEMYGVETSGGALSSALFRPASFFLEPSMFAQYVVLAVMYLRLSKTRDKKSFRTTALFLSVGVVASTSGIGIASLIVVWLLSYWIEIVENKKLLKGLAGVLAFVIVFFVAYLVSDSLRESILRVFGLGETSNYNAFAGRTGGVVFMFEALKGKPELWYGTGEYIVRWYTWGFLGGIFRIIYEYGMIGAILFVLVFFSLGLRIKSWHRWIAFYMLALSLVTGISMQGLLFYYLLICTGTSSLKEKSVKRISKEDRRKHIDVVKHNNPYKG